MKSKNFWTRNMVRKVLRSRKDEKKDESNNFAKLNFLRTLHIIIKKFNFGFSILFF